MIYSVDTTAGVIVSHVDGRESRVPLYSKDGFELLSRLWLKVGWNQKYTYTFSWLGRPVIQLPDDMIRIQEVIHASRPDVILETGIAHGGSLIYYASLCAAMGHGRDGAATHTRTFAWNPAAFSARTSSAAEKSPMTSKVALPGPAVSSRTPSTESIAPLMAS